MRPRRAVKATTPRSLPVNTRVTAWQWEAELVQLPRSGWDRIAQSFADKASELEQSKVVLSSLDVSVGDETGPIVRISSDDAGHQFMFEIGHSYAVYRYEPTRSSKAPDPIGDHIRTIARHFLLRLADDGEINGRLTTAGVVYELSSTLKRSGRPNKQLAIKRLVGGLAGRPWEGAAGSPLQALERIDLQWASRIRVHREKALLWFKVECPSDDSHSIIDTTCVLKSAAEVLPSVKWASAVDEVHRTTWQIAVDFATWLFIKSR